MNTLLAFLAIFSVIVFVHEWGHLYFAKKVGIMCHEFAIGMGPKLFSFERNDTVYTIRLLPIGGYVRMAGEEPEESRVRPGHEVGLVFDRNQQVTEIIVNNKDKHPEAHVVQIEQIDLVHELFIEARDEETDEMIRYAVSDRALVVEDEVAERIAPWSKQFHSKSIPKRAMAIFAGPLMNFVLAFVILLGLALYQGVRLSPEVVVSDSPDSKTAIQAGLETGDVITAVEGAPVSSWKEMTAEIERYPGEEVTIEFERAGELKQTTATLGKREIAPGKYQGVLGVHGISEFSVLGSIEKAVNDIYRTATSIFNTLGLIFTGQFSLDYVAGPVGIYNFTGQAVTQGWITVVFFTAMLSVNIGIINLLPIPAMDGGRLVFLGLEAIRRKPIPREKEATIGFVSFALLMLLIIVVTWNDIHKLFS
ncbi:RIP metalloprotease RseP [Shouchella lonarensis]|uniref:Zinc metalloprotease n=1 Tax=Shouchella lonarensis TaxID=1464122 RepID=A0A1G6H7E1_9BACI|nr:RIP metalloprotease RseP [Shouchella lonarensis]SDB90197.1 site-2 protease. Metallo peptidase. MEROPS family M50B [Shouchella lonarensis]